MLTMSSILLQSGGIGSEEFRLCLVERRNSVQERHKLVTVYAAICHLRKFRPHVFQILNGVLETSICGP